jgi:hypothetical protein
MALHQEMTVNRMNAMGNKRLQEELQRLSRDVEGFRVRVAAAAAAAERDGHDPLSDPLRQRLASIHKFLELQLKDAKNEVERRAVVAASRPGWSLRSALRALRWPSLAPRLGRSV